ncbi:jg27430 [Pararge aegeria aegeria]|uniref:Jg27430 protein n=1 Tax=Pararge aegeria aegeria TaxID=348720 RepID=A0A8S4R1K7_9NEOP|nr:jg27430 [Pararge aegeria aegeria]
MPRTNILARYHLRLLDYMVFANLNRFETLKKRDSDFEFRWRHLGEVAPRSGVTEFDWDSNLEDATTEKSRGK